MKASEMKLDNPKMLFWGAPGSWKTSIVGTLGAKLQLIDLDDNAAVLANFKDKFTEDRRAVDVVQGLQHDVPGQSYGLQRLKQFIMDIHKQCREKTYPFKASAIDSLTTLMEMGKRKVLQTHRDKNPLHELTLSMGQYQFMFNEVYDVLQLWLALPVMKILIAHEETNILDNVQSHEILIPGKHFPSELRKNFPEIIYCRALPAVPGQSGSATRMVLQTIKTYDATARTGLQIPDGTDMSIGLPEILKKAGVEL